MACVLAVSLSASEDVLQQKACSPVSCIEGLFFLPLSTFEKSTALNKTNLFIWPQRVLLDPVIMSPVVARKI